MQDHQKLKCEFILKEDLRDLVEAFRSRYWPTGSSPVDVELIAELSGYEIIPTGLLRGGTKKLAGTTLDFA